MRNYGEQAMEILDELHTERLAYESEYVPLVDAVTLLMEYEQLGVSPKRLKELVEADRDGRIKILPKHTGKVCGRCKHFLRIKRTCRGKCTVKPLVSGEYVVRNVPFEPSQSRKACKQYEED